jgi:nitric oxide reductase subunit B
MLKWSFWGLNGGLASMAVFSLIPSGFYQLYFAVKYGLWFARSPEITSGPVIRALSWARLVPDVIFATGAIVLFIFLLQAIWLTFIKKAEATAFSDRPPREQEAR